MRDKDPVAKLVTFLGMDVWLVTGDAEARSVLGDLTSYSTDVRPYYGKSGAENGDIGGLRLTHPPQHTPPPQLLTPPFTMRPPPPAQTAPHPGTRHPPPPNPPGAGPKQRGGGFG